MSPKNKVPIREILDLGRRYEIGIDDANLGMQIAYAAVHALGFKAAFVSVVVPGTTEMVTKGIEGVEASIAAKYLAKHISLTALDTSMVERLITGRSFFISHEAPAGWQKFVKEYFPPTARALVRRAQSENRLILVCPLISRRDNLLGILAVEHSQDPGQADQEAADVFASVSACALEHERLSKLGMETHARVMEFVSSISEMLSKIQDEAALGDVLVRIGATLLVAEGCSLYQVRGKELELTHSNYLSGTSYIGRRTPLTAAPKAGLTPWVAVANSAILFNNEQHVFHLAWGGEEDVYQYLPSRKCNSLLSVPIRDAQGLVIGVMTLTNKEPSAESSGFDAVDLLRAEYLANQFALGRDRIRLAQDSIQQRVPMERWERAGLEDDLHELINWYHSGVVLGIEAIEDSLVHRDYQKAESLMPELQRHAHSVVGELRNIHSSLTSRYLEIADLETALSSLIQIWVSRSIPKHRRPLHIVLECPKHMILPVPIRSIVLRIVSSALSNAILHSGILTDPELTVLVKAERRDGEIAVSVSDDGIGTSLVPGYGITRMGELAGLIKRYGYDSKLRIDSAIAKGTIVELVVSLSEEDRDVR